MKKLLSLLMAFALPVAAVNTSSAADVKVSGSMDILFESLNNIRSDTPFRSASNGGAPQKHFAAVQKLTLVLDFVASENLSARYKAEVGTFTWGGPTGDVYDIGSGNGSQASGGALGTRAANIVTTEAFLTWKVPGTSAQIRMGQQFIALPGYAFTNPVLAGWGTGIVVSTPVTKSVNLTAFWLRAYSDARRGTAALSGKAADDTVDLGALSADIRLSGALEGFRLTPWVMGGKQGKDAVELNQPFNRVYITKGLLPVTGYQNFEQNADGSFRSTGLAPSNSTLAFAGVSGLVTAYAPFRFAVDSYWSAATNQHRATERSGWYAGASAEYETTNGTPTFKAWYASGDDSNPANGSERPLTLRSSFSPGASVAFNTFAGSQADTMCRGDASGAWGVSAQWNQFSFVPGLTHSLRVTWFQGTNSPAMASYALKEGPTRYLTSKDSLTEIDFDTEYPIYPNLTAMLELSWLRPDFDGRVWKGLTKDGSDARFSDAWRAALGVTYTF